jgi:CBS domain-containing protein
MADLANLTVSPKATMREVMECIDRSGKGIVLVLDGSNRLIGTVTHGASAAGRSGGVNVDYHPVD